MGSVYAGMEGRVVGQQHREYEGENGWINKCTIDRDNVKAERLRGG